MKKSELIVGLTQTLVWSILTSVDRVYIEGTYFEHRKTTSSTSVYYRDAISNLFRRRKNAITRNRLEKKIRYRHKTAIYSYQARKHL